MLTNFIKYHKYEFRGKICPVSYGMTYVGGETGMTNSIIGFPLSVRLNIYHIY